MKLILSPKKSKCRFSLTLNRSTQVGILFSCLFAQNSFAQSDEKASFENWQSEFSTTAIYQHPLSSKLQHNTSLSADFGLQYQAAEYQINIHFEGSTAPRADSIASIIAQSNADVGTALSRGEQGRIQLSELYVSWPLSTRPIQLHLGLIDSTAFFDSSRIANDENGQFISSDFVNNPVIDFPDYALAGVFEYDVKKGQTVRVMLSSTNGIADNPSRDYSSLFEVQDDQKGIFSIVEYQWQNDDSQWEIGSWYHNGDHQALDDNTKTNLNNFGAYAMASKSYGVHSIEFRAGYSNPKVSSACKFVSAAYQLAWEDWRLGGAYAHTQASDYLDHTRDGFGEVELYGRYEISKELAVSPSVQYFRDPVYEEGEEILDEAVWALNLRLNYAF